jgi:hypothetical protein
MEACDSVNIGGCRESCASDGFTQGTQFCLSMTTAETLSRFNSVSCARDIFSALAHHLMDSRTLCERLNLGGSRRSGGGAEIWGLSPPFSSQHTEIHK